METPQHISFKNSIIYYRVYGSGNPVAFIHGFGEDGNIWNSITGKLKERFKVILPDLPGCGRSGILNENAEVSIDDYAEVVMEILKKEAPDKCTVIGHSMGGYITLAIANKYPEKLNGFGLFNSTAFADNEVKKEERSKSIDFIRENGALQFLNKSIPGLFADKFKQEHPDEIKQLIDSANYFTPESLIQYQKAMMNRPERIDVLENTNLPVLFIIGEKDPAIPLEKSLNQCHLPATAYVHILANAGHMGILEEKELSVEIISSYLK